MGRSPLVIAASAVIFDNDGVLVDSGASVEYAWSRWAAVRGLDAGAVVAMAHGRPSRGTVAHYVTPEERVAALAEIDRLELEDARTVTAVPGAAALVARLPADRWAVVTSGTAALAGARLAAAGLALPAVLVTADDVRHGKPDPEGYSLALRRLGADAATAVVLEDSHAGIAAARAAGVGTIVGVGASALGGGATVVVRDLRDVGWDGARLVVDGREP